MKKALCTLSAVICSTTMMAKSDTLRVENFIVNGPFTAVSALRIDSVDAMGKTFDDDKLLNDGISTKLWRKGTERSTVKAEGSDAEKKQDYLVLEGKETPSVYLVGFTFDNTRYANTTINVSSKQKAVTYVDHEMNSNALMPGRHEVVVKVLCKAGSNDTISISLTSKQAEYITVNAEGKRFYTLADYMNGEKASSTALSANGRYLMLNAYNTKVGGTVTWKREVVDLKTNRTYLVTDFLRWSTNDDRYIARTTGINNEYIYEYVDLATGTKTPFYTDYQSLSGNFLNGEKEMLVSQHVTGPKEDPQIHEYLQPDDRIPGWRDRNNLQLLNLENGQLTQLTVGHHKTSVRPSNDGRKLLITTTEDCITERPFNFTTILLYNRDTQQLDTLVKRDGFISGAQFMPDAKSIIIQGSPEAFEGIGKNDPTGKIPSIIQQELFQMDLATRKVRSLTFDFNPSIISWEICQTDGCIYANCENRDRQDIFRINPQTGKTDQLKLSECYVKSFSIARGKSLLSYTGQGDSNADRIYTVDLKTGKETLIRDWNETRMGDVQLGKCEDWNFTNSRGDVIYGRYYLPPHFDSNKKYPMLVYYYGGCSPTGRYLESYYNFHGWAAMGYVVYVVQPSGCTGFGQEFAARHVNTYGEGTAEDIIEGTLQFCKEHPYVNDKKIGCLGASYGGFMTQYLMTKTDIFAASMSHAGISNPTSYWGYGYWGYSYSATSAAHSYPWNNEKLLSGQAPLFNADKVHTPILFLHGSADTNVPINESIQMFTALKILGRECAFVVVDGQDHHITDYEKQRKWVSTYYAWFAKWLQDDDTWWEALYPKKNL